MLWIFKTSMLWIFFWNRFVPAWKNTVCLMKKETAEQEMVKQSMLKQGMMKQGMMK